MKVIVWKLSPRIKKKIVGIFQMLSRNLITTKVSSLSSCVFLASVSEILIWQNFWQTYFISILETDLLKLRSQNMPYSEPNYGTNLKPTLPHSLIWLTLLMEHFTTVFLQTFTSKQKSWKSCVVILAKYYLRILQKT